MKIAILSLLLAAAGVGTYELRGEDAAATPDPCPASDCRVEVECTPQGTCLVTCYEGDGSVRCQQELECDQPCEAKQECKLPCAPAGGCRK